MSRSNYCSVESLESRRLMTYTLTNLHLEAHGGAGIETTANSPDVNNLGNVLGGGNAGTTIYSRASLQVLRGGAVKLIETGNFGAKLSSFARDLNEKNQVVGEFTDSKGVPHAYTSTIGKKDVVTDKKLGDIKGISGTNPMAINASGVVVGVAGLNTGKEEAVVWTPGAAGAYTAAKLPRISPPAVPGMPPTTIATDVSNAGVICGSGINDKLVQRATIWKKGSKGYAPTDLGALSGGFGNSAAYAINELGQVAGMSGAKDFKPHPVLFALNSKGKYGITDLGLPAGALAGEAVDINEKGVIVGNVTMSNGDPHAFLWAKNSKGKYVGTDLETQLPAGSNWTLERPTSINDNNTIVGSGLFIGVATWMLTFSGKGNAIKLAPATASVQSLPSAPQPTSSNFKVFSTHKIAESILL